MQLARHKKTGSLYALKLINLYDKSIRDMLLTELTALFKSDCEALIDFHGATVRGVGWLVGGVGVGLQGVGVGQLPAHAHSGCHPAPARSTERAKWP